MRYAMVLAGFCLLGALGGCSTPDSRQIAWHDQMERMVGKVNDAAGARQFVSTQTLRENCGQADLTTTVQSLHDMMQDSSTTNPELVLSNLYFTWCLSNNLHADEQHPWQKDQNFLSNSAWIYDERRHFKTPLPDSAGFDSYVFLISGNNVVGASVAIPSPVWKER